MLVPEIGDRASDARYGEEIVRKIQVLMMAAAALASLATAPFANAQDFPNRPIHVVIAFPAGGPTDFVGRVISEKMKAVLGQSVIIDNKPGANGTLGGEFVAKSDPDGYTLFLTTAGAVTVSPHIMADIHYDALRDFAPVVLVTKVTEVIVVTPKFGIKTVREIVALAREKPGTISFASTGIGSPPHLTQELLSASANVKFLHVPYRGAAPALTDLLGGQVQALTADVPVLIAQIQAGNLVPIGAAAAKRDAILPDVPTLAEQGYPNTDASNWYGLLAPAKTPPDVIAKLNAAVNAALNDPDIRTKLVQAGATPIGGTPESFGTFMKAEYEKWGRVVTERGIKDTQ
jgi:tripartite-type tricarboxylate transporter receptor subunit TctC